jgi:hypothetical protein
MNDTDPFAPEEPGYPDLDPSTLLEIMIRAHNSSRRPFSKAILDELQGIIKRWERVVYLGGFQAMNRAVEFRGFEMTTDGAETLTHTMAGRVMVTITATDEQRSWISFVCDETATYPRAGLHNASGDIDAITHAVGKCCDAWLAGIRPVRNDKVGF